MSQMMRARRDGQRTYPMIAASSMHLVKFFESSVLRDALKRPWSWLVSLSMAEYACIPEIYAPFTSWQSLALPLQG